MRRRSLVSSILIASVLVAVASPAPIGAQTSSASDLAKKVQAEKSIESSASDQAREAQVKKSIEPSVSDQAREAQVERSIEMSAASRQQMAKAAQSVQAHPAIAESAAAVEKRAVFNQSALGTSRVALYLAHNQDVQLTPKQQEKVLKALADAQTVQEQTADRTVNPTDVERIQTAERQIVLALWDTSLPAAEKTAQLVPNQYGYIFETRFQDLSRVASHETADLTQALQAGGESAAQLARLSDASNSAELQRLLQSFDVASQLALRGDLERSRVALKAASSDLTQQVNFYTTKSGPLVQLTVRTIRKLGSEKDEVKGYNVRYELEIDDTLGTNRGLSLTGTTTLQDHLGPYHYVLWAERDGQSASDKKLINLGDPLLPKREVEISLTGGAQ